MGTPTIQIDPSLTYNVTVSKVVPLAGVRFRPQNEYQVKGSVAVALQAEGALKTIALA